MHAAQNNDPPVSGKSKQAARNGGADVKNQYKTNLSLKGRNANTEDCYFGLMWQKWTQQNNKQWRAGGDNRELSGRLWRLTMHSESWAMPNYGPWFPLGIWEKACGELTYFGGKR